MDENAKRELVERIDALERELADLRHRRAVELGHDRLVAAGFACLECRVAGQTLGILQTSVDEVVMVCELSPIPESPPWIAGLLNLRGTLVPVVDVRARIEGQRREVKLSDVIVVCNIDGRRVGLVVQDTTGVRTVPPNTAQKPPESIPLAPYLVALVPDPSDPLLLVSAEALVASSGVPGAS
jgi:purine-binding chemotaxis protein CheW